MTELNGKELLRVDVIKSVINREITQKEAALKLDLTDRQIRRLIVRFISEGENGLIHKNRGTISNKKIPNDLSNEIVNNYLEKYSEFNFSHYYEEQGMKYGISYSTMFSIIQNEDIISPLAQHKTVRLYNEKMRNAIKDEIITKPQVQLFELRQQEEQEKRVRRSSLHYSFGEEVQMDAASWIWFGSEETFLHLAVDKATKKVLYGFFAYEETTEAYIIILMNIIIIYGIPKKIKTDKRSSFSINNARSSKSKLNVTQFKRICEDLEIQLQSNSNPVFKPNVERENGTFKRRLKAELNVNDIKNIDEANKYLNEVFIPKINDRFSYDINPNKNVMRENSYSFEELNIIISIRIKRTIDNASSIKYFNKYYVPIDLETGEVISFSNHTECIVVNAYNKELYGLIKDKLYKLEEVEKPKTIIYQRPKTMRKISNYKPPANHPWRKKMVLR